MHRIRRFSAVVAVVMIAGAVNAGVAMAVAPSNDTEASAIVFDAVPFTHSMDTSGATPGGPRFCSNSGSVFYRFTPAENRRFQVDLIGSEYDPVLAIYTRNDEGQAQEIGCNDDRFGLDSGLRFRATVGTTYYIMVGECCGNGETGGGPLVLTVSHVVAEPLTATLEFGATGTVDPDTGIATISATVTCNQRSVLETEVTLRQVREEIFVARGSWYTYGQACTPDAPVQLSLEVDTNTSVVFGAGGATARRTYFAAYDGFRSSSYQDEVVTTAITLV